MPGKTQRSSALHLARHTAGRRARYAFCASILVVGTVCGTEPVSRWEFGGDASPIVSWPVTDEWGNIFVIGGVGATPGPYLGYHSVGALNLISLNPAGELRWSLPVAGPTIIREVPARPVVQGGEVWLYIDNSILHVSSDGDLRWRVDNVPPLTGWVRPDGWEDSSLLALSHDGNLFVLPFVDKEPGIQQQEAWAIGPDGAVLWRVTPVPLGGHGGEETWPPPSQTEAPLVAPGGSLVVGCATCMVGRSGLAEVSASTGKASLIYSLPANKYVTFGNLLWDGAAVRHELDIYSGKQWAASLDGVIEPAPFRLDLSTGTGPIWVEDRVATDEGFVLHWAEKTAVVDTPQIFAEERGDKGAQALMATEPSAVIMHFSLSYSSGNADALALVDDDGKILWEKADIFVESTPAPALVDGMVVYVEEDSRKLVAERVPVERVAAGPWSMIGGNPRHTRSAESTP